jgi:hypothetical protein
MDLLQWPAMLVTVLGTWLVGYRDGAHRRWGFVAFVLSNALWVAWGWHDEAWGVIALQVALFALNLRGMRKAKAPAEAEFSSARVPGASEP